MCNFLLVLFVINLIQVFGADYSDPIHHVLRRSPQQIDIQSISQKRVSPDITVVDVVVNEPTRRRYPNQNQYVQPPLEYTRSGNNFYPNGQYQNTPNRRRPEIQIIEVVDPTAGTGPNYQPWQRYPGGQVYPTNPGRYPGSNQGQFYPDNPYTRYPEQGSSNQEYIRGNGEFVRPRPGRPNRRPYKPNPEFHIPEDDDSVPPTPPTHGNRRPGHRHHKHRTNSNENKKTSDESSSEEEKYIFDQGESEVTKYTADHFPIIPLTKNDIR